MEQLVINEYKSIRVLTSQQLADSYETDSDTISKNFNNNKERYTEGKHYILLQGNDLRIAKASGKIYGLPNNANKFYLWTEKGAFLHAKSLNTDKAWELYGNLVDTYFEVKKPFSTMELLELQIKALKEVQATVYAVDNDLQTFKQDMPLLALESEKIVSAVKSKGVNCLGGKESTAYQDKSLIGRVYSDIYGQLKRQFGVATYKAIKRNQCDLAIQIIKGYSLPLALSEEIKDCNSQMVF